MIMNGKDLLAYLEEKMVNKKDTNYFLVNENYGDITIKIEPTIKEELTEFFSNIFPDVDVPRNIKRKEIEKILERHNAQVFNILEDPGIEFIIITYLLGTADLRLETLIYDIRDEIWCDLTDF